VSIDANALASSRDVTVTNSTLGSSTCPSCFMVAPIVDGANPTGVGQGAQDRDVTITGEGFAPGAIAQFGDPLTSPITTNFTQFVDGNTLHANVSVTPGAAVGAYDVTVTDPGFGQGVCTGCFSVNAGPTVTSTSPSSRGAGSANQVVAINGTGFDNGSTVSFGGGGVTVDNTSFVSSTQLLATIDVAQGTPNGTRSVTVNNLDGGQGSCAACFTVNKGPTLVNWDIDQIGGHHAIVFNNGNKKDLYTANVVITGANLQPGVTLSYNNTWLTVNTTTYVSTTKIKQNVTVDVDADANALPGERAITATNPDGGTFTLQGAVVLIG